MYLAFYCIALALAMVIGAQTTPWTWGPGMAALGLAVISLSCKGHAAGKSRPWYQLPGWLCLVWFIFRALSSPVREFGVSDALLVVSVLGAFQVGLDFRRDTRWSAGWVLAVFLAVAILVNAVVVAIQLRDPSYTLVFGARHCIVPTGVLGHYNEFSNVMLALGFALLSFVFRYGLRWWARAILLLVFIAAMGCIYLSRSRGGLMGAGCGAIVFCVMVLLEAKRRKSRWFAPCVILLPFALIAAGWLMVHGLESSQIARNREASTRNLLDDGRLYALGLAAQCAADHPWQGGGSHSFSWESRHHSDIKDTPWGDADIIYVHNELAQAVTDYGLTGGILLVVSLACLFGRAVLEMIRERGAGDDAVSDIWLGGAVAGVAAMLAQSNFAFVFHNLPSVILLGFFLGIMAEPGERVPVRKAPRFGGFGALIAHGPIGIILLLAGIQGTRALAAAWPAQYAKGWMTKQPLAAAGTLARAARYWPHSELHAARAERLLLAARSSGPASYILLLEESEAARRDARRLHPLDPVLAVNDADCLSLLGRNTEALVAYDEAIRLQGGYECGAQGYCRKGLHLRKMAFTELSRQRLKEGLGSLLEANKCFRVVREQPGWYFYKTYPEVQLEVLEMAARLQVQLGLAVEVESSLSEAAALPNGLAANYLYAKLLYDKAWKVWYGRKPGRALALFMQARERLAASSGLVPAGVSPDDRGKLDRGIDEGIKFLQGARVQADDGGG